VDPEISRRVGLIVGTHPITLEERATIVDAVADVTAWGQIPQPVRDLLADIETRTWDDEAA
jgi:hypothetical protein